MVNFNLNAGGVVGGLLGAAGAGAFLFTVVQGPDVSRGLMAIFVAAVVIGALAGNLLWALLFKGRTSAVEVNQTSIGRK